VVSVAFNPTPTTSTFANRLMLLILSVVRPPAGRICEDPAGNSDAEDSPSWSLQKPAIIAGCSDEPHHWSSVQANRWMHDEKGQV
jgi:hypothetical protein